MAAADRGRAGAGEVGRDPGSEHGVWRVLRRVGLNTRAKRLALVARHRDRYERRPPEHPPERHIEAAAPGEKVGLDCFFIGRLSGTKGSVWQYTAIDVASAYAWAEPRSSERNPRARHTRALLHRVARELGLAGWKLGEVTTDGCMSSGLDGRAPFCDGARWVLTDGAKSRRLGLSEPAVRLAA
jgi:hypothetical protein